MYKVIQTKQDMSLIDDQSHKEHSLLQQSSIENKEDSKFISKTDELIEETSDFAFQAEELQENINRWVVPAGKTLQLVIQFFSKKTGTFC